MLNIRNFFLETLTSVNIMYIRAASQILCCKVTVFSGLCNDFEQILFINYNFATAERTNTCSKSVKIMLTTHFKNAP